MAFLFGGAPANLTLEEHWLSLAAPPAGKGPFMLSALRKELPRQVVFGFPLMGQPFAQELAALGAQPMVLSGFIRFPQGFPSSGSAPEVILEYPSDGRGGLPPWEFSYSRLKRVVGGVSYDGGVLGEWRPADLRERGNLGWVMDVILKDIHRNAHIIPRAPAPPAAPAQWQQPQQQPYQPQMQPQQQQPRQQQPQQPQPQQQPPQQQQQQQPGPPRLQPLPATPLPTLPAAFPELDALDRGALEALLADTPEGAAARQGFLLASVPSLKTLLDKERQATKACEGLAEQALEEAQRVAAAGESLEAAGAAARAAHAAAAEARARLQGTALRPEALLERMRGDEARWKAEAEAIKAALGTPAGWRAAGEAQGGGSSSSGSGVLAHHSAFLALRIKVNTVKRVREHMQRKLQSGF